MTHRPVRPPPDEVFSSFVAELARSPQAPDMLGRLRLGHEPDDRGWCIHPAHTHRWEPYPCLMRRLADLADGVELPESPDQRAGGDE